MNTAEKTRDDVINEEIEKEHEETRTVDVEVPPEDERKEFEKKLNDKNFYAIEAALTFKFVDFIDISEFNSQSVTGGEYHEKLSEFLHAHRRLNKEFLDEIISLLKNAGLFLTYVRENGQKYNPVKSNLEALRDSLQVGNLEGVKKVLVGTSSPETPDEECNATSEECESCENPCEDAMDFSEPVPTCQKIP